MSPNAMARQSSDAKIDRRALTILAAAGLVLATIIAYWPAIHAGYIWDDDDYLTGNTHLKDFTGLLALWTPGTTHQYYPMVFTTFWIEHHLWGLRPLGFHLVNVLLHAANAMLVWRVCVRLGIFAARSERSGGGAVAWATFAPAWLIGAVFALHPVHVESVAWITERKNVLSGFFYLLAALAFMRFDDSRQQCESHRARWGWYATSLALFVAALLSKSVTCSLPAALILIRLYQRRRFDATTIAVLAPMFLIGLALALNTAHLERVQVGAEGADFNFSFLERSIIASQALLFYPWKLLVPWPLIFVYPRWSIDVHALTSFCPVLGVLMIATVAAVMYRRGTRGPALCLAYYGITIFPALGFFNIYPMRYTFVADHYQYLASIGILMLVVTAVANNLRNRRLGAILAAVVLAALATLTWQRCWAYESEKVLWRMTALQNPKTFIAPNNLGKILLERGDANAAAEQFQIALSLRNEEFIRANLANALRSAKRLGEAAAQYRILVSRPLPLTKDEVSLARTLDDLGQAEEAEKWYRIALQQHDVESDVHVLLGAQLLRRDRPREAGDQFEAFLTHTPHDAFVRMMLGDSLRKAGQNEQAMAAYEAALADTQRPDDQLQILDRLSSTAAQLNRFDRAIAAASQALALDDQLHVGLRAELERRLSEWRAKSNPPR